MAKQYSRKTLSSLDELELEQIRIRKAYHSIEHHFLESIFQPEKIAFSLGSRLIQSLSSSKKNKVGLLSGQNAAKATHFSPRSGSRLYSVCSPFLKRMARSWVRWQAFNLAFFLGKKAVNYFQKRRKD